MRISLKLLLLTVTLVAILAAWIRVRSEAASTALKLLQNANQGKTTVTIPEASAPPSRLTIDATGNVMQAHLYGPAGYAAISEHTESENHISSIWFGSTEAITLFEPDQFPNLSWLAIDDSFDIDFTSLSLEWLKSIRRLEGLNMHASTSDPRPALTTLPQMQPLMLVLRTNQVDDFDVFPQIQSVTNLSIGVPDGRDTAGISRALQHQLANCALEVHDGYNP